MPAIDVQVQRVLCERILVEKGSRDGKILEVFGCVRADAISAENL